MRVSVIVASHNEGQRLKRTLETVVATCEGLDYELIVADDASTDGSIKAVRQQFPGIQVVRHKKRRGASPTKALGADRALGEVLVFLDGHTKPERGAVERLVQDVERAKGRAIFTPQIVALDDRSWQNNLDQIGNGYATDLETLDVWWISIQQMKAVKHAKRQFYESPALIGCAFAISRELYQKLWGFDKGMQQWGVEDLDFGLKCWLMGYRILHDPVAVIGHRFQHRFNDYTVASEHLLVNQLRAARKYLTETLWENWVERAMRRNHSSLAGHPEGLWAHAWEIFQAGRTSVEKERAYLLGNRKHDELWYAKRFGLFWPVLGPDGKLADEELPPLTPYRLEASPSPSPGPRRLVLLLGYWPPTDTGHMLSGYTVRAQYKTSNYDVLAISASFPQVGWIPSPPPFVTKYYGRGSGQFEVDYLLTSSNFWSTVPSLEPIAIMSFSWTPNNSPVAPEPYQWILEPQGRNLPQTVWKAGAPYSTYWGLNAPYPQQTLVPVLAPPYIGAGSPDPAKGVTSTGYPLPNHYCTSPKSGNPPDATQQAWSNGSGGVRQTTLPTTEIVNAVNAVAPANPTPPRAGERALSGQGDAGGFLSEFMAYHVSWYRDWTNNSNASCSPSPAPSPAPGRAPAKCKYAGHTHVRADVSDENAKNYFEAQLAALIAFLG